MRKHRTAFAVLVFRQQPQVLARYLNRFVAGAGIFVAEGRHLHNVTAAAIGSRGDIQSALPIVRNREVDVEALHSRLEQLRQCLRWRRRIRVRNVEQQAIRKDAGGARNHQLAFGKHLLVEDQLAEAPGAELKRLQAEIQRVLDKPVLHLQMLRSEKRAFGPDDRLQLFHRIPDRVPTIAIPRRRSKEEMP